MNCFPSLAGGDGAAPEAHGTATGGKVRRGFLVEAGRKAIMQVEYCNILQNKANDPAIRCSNLQNKWQCTICNILHAKIV